MNMFKILSVALLSVCILFLSCKKESLVNNVPSVVEITVCTSNGELLVNQPVRMYDEVTYEAFKKDHTVKALLEIVTDQNGIASFVLENKQWFSGKNSRELMFVVLDAANLDNYEWWSRGGTVTAGKKSAFKIEVVRRETIEEEEAAPESPFLIENGTLMGIKDPSLTHVVLPDEVKNIAPGAFWESKIESLVLNEGLVSIGVQAFARSRNLTSVTFPASLQKIEGHAFEDCVALEEINLSGTNLKEIGSSAFRETGLKKVFFPASLEIIASQAFLKTQLENVILPENLQEIGREAFRETAALRSVTIPDDIQKIGYQAFYACIQLDAITSAGKMKSADGIIESGAFEGCRSLQKVILPLSISELQEGIFMECVKLQEIVLPEHVRKIGDYGLRTNYPVGRIEFKCNEVPEVGNGVLPFLEDLSEIMVPKGKQEIYKAKFSSFQHIIKETR